MRVAVAGPLLLLVAGFVVTGCSSSSDGVTAPSTTVGSASTSSFSASARSTTPPTIPESFTLLPCPNGHPVTTVHIEGCAEHRILALDRRVEAAARAAVATLTTAGARRDLVDAQYDWIAYRKSACTSEADVYAGGTLQPVAFADCEVRLDRARLADLKVFRGQ